MDATASRWIENSSGLLPFAGAIFDPEDVAAVDSMARSYLSGRRPLFDQRVAGGRACDGHGDLLAEDIFLLDDGPWVLDCLEFDDRLRYGDVLADVAFLAMDLERLDRPDLGDRFLVDYAHFAGDSWPDSLAAASMPPASGSCWSGACPAPASRRWHGAWDKRWAPPSCAATRCARSWLACPR